MPIPRHYFRVLLQVLISVMFALIASSMGRADASEIPALVFVRVPANDEPTQTTPANHFPVERYVDGCQIVRLATTGGVSQTINLTDRFVSARDPVVSPDGSRILFAGRQREDDSWQIWSMDRDGNHKEQITHGAGYHVSPLFVGALFYLEDKAPTEQIVYVGSDHGWLEAPEGLPALALYACNPDGSNARRITFNLHSDFEPDVLPNGRIVFSSWQPDEVQPGVRGMIGLLAVNIDGTDCMSYVMGSLPAVHREMVRVDRKGGRVYFIESVNISRFGGGALAFVSQKRPLKSRAVLAPDDKGLYHSPCPLPEGGLLASYRPNEPGASFGIYRIDTTTGKLLQTVYSEPGTQCIDTQVLEAHPGVKGRSSVVGFRHKDTGVFFCLSAFITDRPEVKKLPQGSVKKVRVIEGVPLKEHGVPGNGNSRGSEDSELTGRPGAERRILGVAPVESDGSFHIRVPAQTPVAFQVLDEKGVALAGQTSWSWVMPGESRGCIGCHEDREMAPPNRLAQAIVKSETTLALPPERGRSVDYLSSVLPVIQSRCTECHSPRGIEPDLTEPLAGYKVLVGSESISFAVPVSARNSPLIERLLKRSLSTPDESAAHAGTASMTTPCGSSLNDEELTLFIEWMDLGAPYGSRAVSALVQPESEIRSAQE